LVRTDELAADQDVGEVAAGFGHDGAPAWTRGSNTGLVTEVLKSEGSSGSGRWRMTWWPTSGLSQTVAAG
jgi:hypothetical protein